MREEGIPFIGDLCFMDKGVFGGSCISGNLSVSDLNIQDNVFEVELNLRSAIQKDQLNQEGAHVIIGIDIEIITREGTTLPGTLRANMLHGRPETDEESEEPKNIRLKITSTLLKKIEKTYSGIVEIRDRTLQFQDFILHSMKVVPGDYFIKACSIMDFSSTSLKMTANGVDFLKIMEDTSGMIDDLWNSIQKIKFCVNRDDCELIDELHKGFLVSQAQFRVIIQDVANNRTARGLENSLSNVELQCRLITEFFNGLKLKFEEVTMKYRKKARFWKVLLEDGIEFLGGDCSLSKYLKNNDVNVFLIFLKENFDHKLIFNNINYVYTLMNQFQKRSIFLVIDLDVVDVGGLIKIPKSPAIYHYNNKLLSEDVVKDLKNQTGTGFVYFSNCIRTQLAPEKRTVLSSKCPGRCSGKIIEWRCAKCKAIIEYGFDKRFYCDCGGYDAASCKFKCSDYKHGDPVSVKDFESLHRVIEDLPPLEEVNILLIGQSGVGKSTWINGIVNYLTFTSLGEAEKNDVIAVVPTQFTISDEEFKTHHISVGEDHNEAQIVGASATQGCRSYAIVTKEKIIRLIDTPGIGDTRGYEQDAENLVKIVQHLQHVKKIHGICFLVKPNEARLEACFNFCIKELFSFLHKKARNNIVFCFTNSRSTNYKPANSQPLIKKVLDDANTNIRLNENTIYCFDNESFRFLCAVKNNLNFSKDERESFANSWKRSVKETNRLISNVGRLEPYDVSLTKSIADLRHKMSMVIDAFGEIAKNSETFTIQSLEGQRSDYSRKIADLNKSSNIQETTLRQETVPGNGDIVCTNASCTEKFNNDTIYKTRCCEGCKVSQRYETLTNNELLACNKFSNQVCSVCNCRWEQHMITRFKQVKETKTKVATDVQEEIDKTRRLQASLQLQLVKARKEVEAEESEKKALIEYGTKIFRYLRNQSLVLYNDSLKDYLDYLISSEESKPDKKDAEKRKIKKLNELKNKHEEEIKIAEAVKSEIASQVTLRDIVNEEVFVEMLKHYKKKPNRFEEVLTHSQKIIRLKNA